MKIVFASEAEIPEQLKSKAVAVGDGTFTYEGTGLVDKNTELLGEVNKYKGIAALLKGLDTTQLTPDKIRQALEDHEKGAEREQEVQRRIQAAIADNVTKTQATIEAANKKVTTMQSSLERYLLDSQLTSAIAAEKGDPLFVAPVLRNKLKVVSEVKDGVTDYHVRVLKDNGEIDLDAQGIPVTVNSLVATAKTDKKFASVFAAPAASGSGTVVPGAGAGAGAGAGEGAAAGFAVKDGKVTLTREQAKNAVTYREALGAVKGVYRDIIIQDAVAPAAAATT